MSHKAEAEEYARNGLDGNRGAGGHEHRMRQLAYAQVQATLHLAEQVRSVADALGEIHDEVRNGANALGVIGEKQ